MPEKVFTGSKVTLLREDGRSFDFVLVPPTDANINQGRLSVGAPLGKALLGRHKGEEFSFNAPGGPVRMKVLDIQPTSG
ncbi:MAG: GreA/GreB family elongation factor [candidate division NC10 bacterium]|nr:GreA/GreB family elongation factor [candidate division NC10 bacterium]MBI2457663.1 GreA/GreB family elongation factor [candidate division NC10 bacterium]MBI2562308.1 GreA/GreB family elongation factor [candidate division NC10 bacterium]MBI3084684.1 GreA/GreB family elongation factor [candidate division NC10 bacterium]